MGTAKTKMSWMLHLHLRKRKKHQRSCTRRTTGPMTILASAQKRRLRPRPRPRLRRPRKPRPKRPREAPTAQSTRWISLAWGTVPRRLIGRAERAKLSTTTSVSATANRRNPEKQLSNNKRLPERNVEVKCLTPYKKNSCYLLYRWYWN